MQSDGSYSTLIPVVHGDIEYKKKQLQENGLIRQHSSDRIAQTRGKYKSRGVPLSSQSEMITEVWIMEVVA